MEGKNTGLLVVEKVGLNEMLSLHDIPSLRVGRVDESEVY